MDHAVDMGALGGGWFGEHGGRDVEGREGVGG